MQTHSLRGQVNMIPEQYDFCHKLSTEKGEEAPF